MSEHPERALVQSVGNWYLPVGHSARQAFAKPAGTITWAEHLEAYEEYSKLYGTSQSAMRLHQRGGFCYQELIDFLGHEPTTWVAR